MNTQNCHNKPAVFKVGKVIKAMFELQLDDKFVDEASGVVLMLEKYAEMYKTKI